MLSEKILYELSDTPLILSDNLLKSFERLPADKYAEENLRSRRYSRYVFHGDGTLERRSQKDFMQTSDINEYLGDIERHYEEIEEELERDSSFLQMFKELRARTNLSPQSLIEAHQIRWHCRRNVKAPAPEGVHQDGFDFLGIFMIETKNVDGGEAMFYRAQDEAPCFKKALGNGEFAVINDRKMFHNAAPLVPTANNEDGHWDVIVLTANNVI